MQKHTFPIPAAHCPGFCDSGAGERLTPDGGVGALDPPGGASDHWTTDVAVSLDRMPNVLPADMITDLRRLCVIVAGLPGYEFRSQAIEDAALMLHDASEMDDVTQAMAKVARDCGFAHVSIVLLNQGEAIAVERRVSTTFDRNWLAIYDRQKYRYQDPVILQALTGDDPFLFSDLTAQGPWVERFWEDAEAAGVGRNGCCFTFVQPRGTRIAVSFTSTTNAETTRRVYERHRSDLMVLGELAAEAFVELGMRFPSDQSRLADDELRLLKAISTSAVPEEIEGYMHGEAYASVRSFICHKLGVASLVQALAVASRERWFDDLPFDGSEVSTPYPGRLERPNR